MDAVLKMFRLVERVCLAKLRSPFSNIAIAMDKIPVQGPSETAFAILENIDLGD